VKPIRHKQRNIDVIVVLLLLASLVLGGSSCAPRRMEVVPLKYKDVLDLNSDDIVRIMRQAGFPNEQILEFGVEVHDALAHAGAAQITLGTGRRRVREAVFAINGDAVYISSRTTGNSIYNVKTGWVGVDGP